MECLVSVSSAPIAALGDKKYYDLIGTIGVLKKILSRSVVDGFELQVEPEWDSKNPPLTDGNFADWTKTPKYTAREVVALLENEALPILSVHASRDVGNYLCSNQERDLERGKQAVYDALFIADELKARVGVFHVWDTRATSFNLDHIREALLEVARQFPMVKTSVENVPTYLKGFTPFNLVKHFDCVTLDLRWAALYNELNAFESIADKIVNVHLRGKLGKGKWVLEGSSFDFYQALKKLKYEWGYDGLLTIEPEGKIDSSCFDNFATAVETIRSCAR
jgi:sugar phosphate isomerase/epimerase